MHNSNTTKIININTNNPTKPTEMEARQAVQVLLEYIGEDLSREGLQDTPKRVINSYQELFSGYKLDPAEILNKQFHDISSYKDIVLLREIDFSSICEHHMLPFSGTIDIAYIPNGFVVGLSKIARLVDSFAKRLQIQEKMTAEIADSFQKHIEPLGVAIRVSASHSCMTTRGAMKGGSMLDSIKYTGLFATDPHKRQEFWNMLKKTI